MRSCQLEGSVGTQGPATSHPRWVPPMGAAVEHPPKPTREALGSCCPGQPALLRFAGWKRWEGAAGVHKWLSSPEHSHGPVQLCSNRGAVLLSSSIHLLPACQGAQSSLPAAEQVQQRPGCCLSCRDLGTCCWLWDGADPSCHLPQPSSESALPTSGHLLASCAPDTLLPPPNPLTGCLLPFELKAWEGLSYDLQYWSHSPQSCHPQHHFH